VSSLVGTFPKTKWAQIPRENFRVCVDIICCCWRPYCTDPYSPYNKERGHDFRGSLLAWKSRLFECFLVAVGPYCSGRTTYYGHIFLGIVFEVGHTVVRIWHDFQGRICGGQFWCCEVFSLGWKL
jgi:hypothetical protein